MIYSVDTGKTDFSVFWGWDPLGYGISSLAGNGGNQKDCSSTVLCQTLLMKGRVLKEKGDDVEKSA